MRVHIFLSCMEDGNIGRHGTLDQKNTRHPGRLHANQEELVKSAYEWMRFRAVASISAVGVAVIGLVGPASAQDESVEELMRQGGPLFEENCSVCHGARGEGTGNGPALAGNGNIESRALVINQILWGDSDHGMPSFADVLNDREIAAIATYVRNSWDNDHGIIFPRSVELRR